MVCKASASSGGAILKSFVRRKRQKATILAESEVWRFMSSMVDSILDVAGANNPYYKLSALIPRSSR
jgi:hypothetical protein